MRKIGAHVSSAGGPHNAIKNAQNIGANCLQIFAGSPRMWARSLYPPEVIERYRVLEHGNSLDPVFIHALYLVNLASDNPDLLEKSKKALLMDLKNGDQINSAGVIVHIGSHQGRGFGSVKEQIVTSVKELLSQTETTPFLIENSAGQNGKIGSLEEIKEMVEGIDNSRVGVCLDTAHLFEEGWDLNDMNQVEVLVKKLSDLKLLSKLALIHLNDSKTPLGSGRDQHENIGEGEIGKEGLSNFMNHPELKHLPLILEVPGFDGKGPDVKNIELVTSLATTSA